MGRMLRPTSVAVVGASRTGQGLGSVVLRHVLSRRLPGQGHRRPPGGGRAGGGRLRQVALRGRRGDRPRHRGDSRRRRARAARRCRGRGGARPRRGVGRLRRGGARRHRAPAAARLDRDRPGHATHRPERARRHQHRSRGAPERIPGAGTARPGGGWGSSASPGALGSSILERFAQRGLGVSSFVSAGNRADVSGNDLLQYWEEDPTHLPGAPAPRDDRQRPEVRPHRAPAGPEQARHHGPQRRCRACPSARPRGRTDRSLPARGRPDPRRLRPDRRRQRRQDDRRRPGGRQRRPARAPTAWP